VSIDNKHFFHTRNSKYHVEVIQRSSEDVMEFNFEEYRENFVFKPFNQPIGKDGDLDYLTDVFIENDETEIDKEMVDLVASLNAIRGIKTTGSCSGHYVRKPWVMMQFNDLESLCLLLRIINHTQFEKAFVLSSDPNIAIIQNQIPTMTLFCKKCLPFARKHLNKLSTAIRFMNARDL